VDLLTALDRKSDYSKNQLQAIVTAWTLSAITERRSKISVTNGDVSEDDYDKRSLYALLYAIYRSLGEVKSETGEKYEFTFNTWGYTWPEAWGPAPNRADDPQRYGRNAYSGLYHFDAVKERVKERDGRVHIVEMGCGTGAGAHHVCSNVLPKCTYEAVDMQMAAIKTCRRKFVPSLNGRLVATCNDATQLQTGDGVADFIAVNETHVTEMSGVCTDEDRRFFSTAKRLLKPGGFLVWGNAIPESTWAPCFEYLESIGMHVREVCDVTKEAIKARDEDKRRIDTYVDQCIEAFYAFRLPIVGAKRAQEAEIALKNFARNPGTNLYDTMVNGTDTYKSVLVEKLA
jgi:ubiquinone/menaquinone biosynthesis C-methylase UbiE